MSQTTTRSPALATPRVIAVSGPAGSGKTTLARALAAHLGYALADLDTVTGPLTEIALGLFGELGVDAEAGLDSPAGRRLRAARYATLLDVARANLAVGLGVVLSAPFTSERHDAAAWDRATERLGLEPGSDAAALLYLSVPADELRRRLSLRAADRDHAKLLRGPDGPGSETLIAAAIVLDGTEPAGALLRAALASLGTAAPPAPGSPRDPANPANPVITTAPHPTPC
jgi:predicted kinase